VHQTEDTIPVTYQQKLLPPVVFLSPQQHRFAAFLFISLLLRLPLFINGFCVREMSGDKGLLETDKERPGEQAKDEVASTLCAERFSSESRLTSNILKLGISPL
jgi:hypothetical protein